MRDIEVAGSCLSSMNVDLGGAFRSFSYFRSLSLGLPSGRKDILDFGIL